MYVNVGCFELTDIYWIEMRGQHNKKENTAHNQVLVSICSVVFLNVLMRLIIYRSAVIQVFIIMWFYKNSLFINCVKLTNGICMGQSTYNN